MSDDIAIRVENLGKRYRIGGDPGFDTLRDAISGGFNRLLRRTPRARREDLWALKDVSFEVKRGEIVGIIGRNGAGKSTLLKILSRITEPTEGRALVRGRVRALLEVGTGFHGELTGRENIYVSGAILGMRKAEIDRKFDEIVAFAEIEKFLDTPIKHYSSGMYVRLAFAVAAHLEPEILLVDEVLAVGDVAFQKKCLGRMGEVTKEGRTILFVSHNMPAIQRICGRALLVNSGKIVHCGDSSDVVQKYYRAFAEDGAMDSKRIVPEGSVGFTGWSLIEGKTRNAIFSGDSFTFRIHLVVRRHLYRASFGLALMSEDGTWLVSVRSLDRGGVFFPLTPGEYDVLFRVASLPLNPGCYPVYVTANEDAVGTLDILYLHPPLTILPKYETGQPSSLQGLLQLDTSFSILKTEALTS